MTQSQFQPLAIMTAKSHGIDPTLLCAVVEQESNWNPWADRYEPAFEEKYIKPMIVKMPPTEELDRAKSFGLMQVMGEVARELGFTGPFLTQLCDPGTGLEYGARKLKKCLADTPDVIAALLRWNGGSNPNYAAEVLARVAHYQ